MNGIKKTAKWILSKVSGMKLRYKLLLSYFLLILVPFSIFFVVSDNMVSGRIETLVRFSARQSFDQSAAFITNKLEKITDTMNVILENTRISTILSQDPASLDLYTQIHDMNELLNYLQSFKNSTEIYNVIIYLNDKFIYSYEKINLLSMQGVENESWYRDMMASSEKLLWVMKFSVSDAPSQKVTYKAVTALKPILDPGDYTHTIGVLRVDMLESNLNAILQKTTLTQNSAIYIRNSKNEIISSFPESVKPEYLLDDKTLNSYTQNGTYTNVQEMDGMQVLLTCRQLPNTDWTLVSITPYADLITESRQIFQQMLLWFLCIGTAAYGLAYLISFSITRRIGRLISQMRRMKTGNFSTIASNSGDEIGELIDTFNEMSVKMERLVEEKFRTGQAAKNAEMLALQAQINPHFLYNTLDLINWTAINNNVPEIAATVQSLSRFYKISLSKGTSIISIRDEIEHVKMYVDIQNHRFGNVFTLEIDVEPEVYDHTIIKITLQPIVENAIIHGILQKEEKRGTIRITGRIAEGAITLAVQDDGIGIAEDRLDAILSESPRDKEHGYGIRNIHERLQLLYGERYGLVFKNANDGGAIVELCIPLSIYNQRSPT